MLDTIQTEKKEDNNRIFYAGYADHEDAKKHGKDTTWKVFPATDKGYKQARSEGYTAVSAFEFSHQVPNNKSDPQPIRYGDLILDFDAKKIITTADGTITHQGDIEKARLAVIVFTEHLRQEFSVAPDNLRYYASGGKGFHVIIPAELFGGEHGNIHLHEIYAQMVKKIISMILRHKPMTEHIQRALDLSQVSEVLLPLKDTAYFDKTMCIDDNFFKGGKGQLLRLPNIKRADGKYKIPVTYDEICRYSEEDFCKLVLQDRELNANFKEPNLTVSPGFESLFLENTRINNFQLDKNRINAADVIQNGCEFINFFKEKPHEVDEPRWFMLAKVLAYAGKMGSDLFHALSSLDQKRYNYSETQKKLENAKNYGMVTCQNIRDKEYCHKQCGIKSPIDMYQKKHSERYTEGFFEVDADGLCYYPFKDNLTQKILLASHIKIIALARDKDSRGWAKYVEIKDPDNVTHYCTISNAELNGSGDQALTILSNLGLDYNANPKEKKLLLQYLRSTAPQERALLVAQNGWIGNMPKFYPLDAGVQENGDIIHSQTSIAKNPFEQKGTLEEWQEHIAEPCEGNPLLQLAILTALSGPFLKPTRHHGFGIHLYGNSSSGKTTCLKVAASVTGGEVKTWRTTDNALESTANDHNDNCLFLDEIGQCTPEVVDHTTYMLSNGQGKARLTKAVIARPAASWLLVYLSTGELPIAEKIRQGFNKTPMAGQEVRCINILADGKKNHGVFSKIPADTSPADFSNVLVEKSSALKGVALQEAVKIIKIYRTQMLDFFTESTKSFLNSIDAELSSQAGRVVRHFAFLAAVGEFCIHHKLLPWMPNSAINAAIFCFEQWRKENGSSVQYEIKAVEEKILNFIKHRCSDSMYSPLGSPINNEGKPFYRTKIDDKNCAFIANQYLIKEKLCRADQIQELKTHLKEQHLLALDKNGNIKEQDYHGPKRPRTRGLFIIMDNLYLDDPKDEDATLHFNDEYDSSPRKKSCSSEDDIFD